MKKILFISVRNPYSGRYSGDVIRSFKILKLLKKKYDVNCVYLKKKEESNIEDKNDLAFKHPNFLLKIIYCFLSLIRIEPVHFGLFYSSEMKNYLENHASQYDYLFFYHIRSSQFLPKDYNGKTILEMGDLYSYNYYQILSGFVNYNLFDQTELKLGLKIISFFSYPNLTTIPKTKNPTNVGLNI